MGPIIDDSLPTTDDVQHIGLRKRTQSKLVLGVRKQAVFPFRENSGIELGMEFRVGVVDCQVG